MRGKEATTVAEAITAAQALNAGPRGEKAEIGKAESRNGRGKGDTLTSSARLDLKFSGPPLARNLGHRTLRHDERETESD